MFTQVNEKVTINENGEPHPWNNFAIGGESYRFWQRMRLRVVQAT